MHEEAGRRPATDAEGTDRYEYLALELKRCRENGRMGIFSRVLSSFPRHDIDQKPTTMTADLKGQLRIDANKSNVYNEHRRNWPTDGHTADYAVALAFFFDLRDLSTLSVTLV